MWNSGRLTVAKAYKHLSGHRTIHPSFSWIWKCSCQNKHKVFAWLILRDRSTRELLKRKNMEFQDYTCVLCSRSTEETLFHLLIDCPFASTCWNRLGLQVTDQEDLYQYLESFGWQLHVPFFMEIIILMSWTIWQMRMASSSETYLLPSRGQKERSNLKVRLIFFISFFCFLNFSVSLPYPVRTFDYLVLLSINYQ
jgi:hypothetical protein